MNSNNCELISIIIPVYNVEKYIGRCIKSIKNQTYRNFEAIVVNDGTKDKSVEIAKKIIDNDNRFVILNKANGGLSSARNYGLNNMRGKYVVFIDSDDFVSEKYIENLYCAMSQNSEVDIAVSRIIDVNADGNEISVRNGTNKTMIIPSEKMMRKMMLERTRYNHCAYGKLYKSEFWIDFRFPNGRLYEDYLTTYKLFSKANKVAIIDKQDYYYVQQQGSIMHMPISSKTLTILDVSDEITEWIRTNNSKLYLAALELQMATYLKTLQKIINYDSKNFIESQERICKFVKLHSKEMLLYRYTPIKDRIKIVLFNVNKGLFISIYNRIG